MFRWLKWLLVLRQVRRDHRTRAILGAARGLSWQQRVSFVSGLARDRRLPFRVRVAPLLLAAYLVAPIDVIPDFIPVLGQMDDMAVVAMVFRVMERAMPPDLLQEHLRRVRGARG